VAHDFGASGYAGIPVAAKENGRQAKPTAVRDSLMPKLQVEFEAGADEHEIHNETHTSQQGGEVSGVHAEWILVIQAG
jgi:hypothetical protein